MFWLLKKSKKKKNLYNLRETLRGIVDKQIYGKGRHVPTPTNRCKFFKRRRFNKNHTKRIKYLKLGIVQKRSFRLFIPRFWYKKRKYWRRVFIRKYLKKKRKKITGPRWVRRWIVKWNIYNKLPAVTNVYYGNDNQIVCFFALPVKKAINQIESKVWGGFQPRKIVNLPKKSKKPYKKRWKAVNRYLRRFKRRWVPHFFRKLRGYRSKVRRRFVFRIKKFKYKVVKKTPTVFFGTYRSSRKKKKRLHDLVKKPTNIRQLSSINLNTNQKILKKKKGHLMNKLSATKHYLRQNVSKSFEFENWWFWEEFVYVRDHPKKLNKRLDKQLVISYKKKKQRASGSNRTMLLEPPKWFLYNKRFNVGTVRLLYHLDIVIKFFTISTDGWHRLLRLLYVLLVVIGKKNTKFDYRLVKKLKQVMYLISELDYLVISRIESGILPSYRIDRSTKRGYSRARRRFRAALSLVKGLGRPKTTNQGKNKHLLPIRPRDPNGIIWKKRILKEWRSRSSRLGLLKRLVKTDRFFSRLVTEFLDRFWKRKNRYNDFMDSDENRRIDIELMVMEFYFRRFPRRRRYFFRMLKFQKRRKWKRRLYYRRKRSLIGRELARAAAARYRPGNHKYLVGNNNWKIITLPTELQRTKIQSGIYKTLSAQHKAPPNKGHVIYRGKTKINKGLDIIKKKLPKFRVKKKLRNIFFHRIIKKKKNHFFYTTSIRIRIKRNINIKKNVWKKEFLYRKTATPPRIITTTTTKRVHLNKMNSKQGIESKKKEPYTYIQGVCNKIKKVEMLEKCNIRLVSRLITRFVWRKRSKVRIADLDYTNTVVKNNKSTKAVNTDSLKGIKLPKVNTKLKSPNSGGNVTTPYPQGWLRNMVNLLLLDLNKKKRKKRKIWLPKKKRSSTMQIRRTHVAMGMSGVSLKLMSSLGIKQSLGLASKSLLHSVNTLQFRFRKFFKKYKYTFTFLLLMSFMDVSVWSSYLNRLFYRTAFFRQRRLFYSLRSLLPQAARICGLHSSIKGMYMCFKGKVATRGGLRKRTLRSSYGWYTSSNFGLQYKYRFKQVWSKSGAIGLKTIITCGNTHINIK